VAREGEKERRRNVGRGEFVFEPRRLQDLNTSSSRSLVVVVTIRQRERDNKIRFAQTTSFVWSRHRGETGFIYCKVRQGQTDPINRARGFR
jgi:hypothetical protein